MPLLMLPLLVLPLAGLLAACSPESPASNEEREKTLKLLYWQAPTILNPHLSNGFKDSEASRITLEPLASYDKNGEMVPFLAAEVPTLENGLVAADGKSVIWNLEQGIEWSDGKPFTAADVVFTYEFLVNPEVASNTAAVYESIENVEAIDDYTVKVNFKEPNPAWSLPFVGIEGMILPRHLYKEYNGANVREAPYNLMPVGTGPYKVVEFKPGDTVVYEPNPFFRESDRMGFEKIILKGGGDSASAARAVLQTGDADYAYNLQVEPQVLQQFEAAGKGKVVAIFSSQAERILINQTDPNRMTADGERSSLQFPHPFFTDKKVRQGFNLAIDREAIATQLYGSTGKATTNYLVSPESYNSKNTKYEFNLEKAASLLDEAGWKDSNGNGIRDKDGVEMKVVFQTSINPVRQKTQQIIKQSLKSIGIEVELKSIDASTYFSGDPANPDTVARFESDLQMFTTGNQAPIPDNYMKGYLCDDIPQKSNNWSKQNYARYCNPAYEALWEKAEKELDPEKRRELFIQMNDLLVNEVVVMPIVHRAEAIAISNSLAGLDLTPWDRNTWNIADWKRIER
ncbi:MAG: peptide ABC transporter substrate-binding protein [Oscillatoria sp. SIO1A7]|nr:peptide ABC transporter substrate-binding protein [Oscillatoria sp. SIO1A7]